MHGFSEVLYAYSSGGGNNGSAFAGFNANTPFLNVTCLLYTSTLAEETIHPEKNIGKGIIIALCTIVVVFVLQTYVAALILPDWENTDLATGFFDAAALAGGEVFRKDVYKRQVLNLLESALKKGDILEGPNPEAQTAELELSLIHI